MSLVLIVSGVWLLVTPSLIGRAARRLPVREWAAILGCSLVVGAASLELGLVVVALPTVLRQLGVPALALACQRMLHSLAPGGPGVGWLAAGLASALTGRFITGRIHAVRAGRAAQVEAALGEHHDRGWYELVVLPSDRPLAVSVAGAVPQVTITTGLLHVIADDELEAVLRHEEAHLRAGHHHVLADLAGLEAALGFLPPVRRGVMLLRLALERSADEEAAARSAGGRDAVRAALACLAAGPSDGVVAFSGADGVTERLDALGRPAPRPSRILRSLAWTPAVSLGGVAATAATMWASQAHAMLAMAGMCRA